MIDLARWALDEARASELLLDGRVATCGDDLSLIMTHTYGADAQLIHEFAWDVFTRTTALAKDLGLYGAGQDLLSDAFSGNLRGMSPGYAELDFEERPFEPVICFLADKAEPGAWNLALYKMFADPFNTAGLVIDAKMHDGFVFEVYDLFEEKRIFFDCPGDLYDLLMYIGAPARYVIHSVWSKALGEVAAATSTQRLSLIAGKYVGKDDPVMAVRCQSGLPAVGEVLEPFAFPYAVAGCMRGSHHAPLMPVSVDTAHPSRFDGPSRVVALGFQVTHGRLIGYRDLFDDPAFDDARRQANAAMDYLRRHGPFEPHRLPLEVWSTPRCPVSRPGSPTAGSPSSAAWNGSARSTRRSLLRSGRQAGFPAETDHRRAPRASLLLPGYRPRYSRSRSTSTTCPSAWAARSAGVKPTPL